MRLRYLMLPIIIVSIMILVLDVEQKVENKIVFNNNIDINYPFFGIEEIDSYITNYLNKNINKKEELLIDYDYIENGNTYYLTFYKNQFNNNKIKSSVDTFKVDIKNNKIEKTTPVTYEYDIVHNKVIDKESKMIALTFDDGPNYNTNKVLEVLESYNVTATFFVLGSNIKGNEHIIKRIKESGSEIGNHTYNHKILTRLKEDEIREEINSTSNQIYSVIGDYPNLLRPSYGIVNKKVKQIAETPIIIWDIDTLDWKYHNSKKIAGRVLSKAKDGDIVLMHDVYSSTSNALKIIIPELKERGYTFVTVSELFYYKGIELVNGKVYGSA